MALTKHQKAAEAMMGDGTALRYYTDAAEQDDYTAIAWYRDITKSEQALTLHGNPTVKKVVHQTVLLTFWESQRRSLDATN